MLENNAVRFVMHGDGRTVTRRRLLAFFGAAPLVGPAIWERHSFPDWPPDVVERLLSDSPWAKPVRLSLPCPPEHNEFCLTVRWSTALPVRQALALRRWSRSGIGSPEAVEFLSREEPECLLEILSLPRQMAPRGTRRLEAELLQTAGLRVAGSVICPVAAYVPKGRENLSAELRFSRSDLRADGGALEFAAAAGPARIQQTFRGKAMVYRGRLEL